VNLQVQSGSLKSSKAFRWTVGVGASVMVALGLVLMFLLTLATGNRELYERNYDLLFSLNIAVAMFLLLVIGWIALRLGMRLRRGKFGSRLLVKLAAIFGLVGLLPGLMIYVVSYQFVSRSIESWFDVEVESALAAGLNLGRVTLETLATDLGNKTRQAANQLSETPDATAGLALERLRDQLAVGDVVLWSASGQLIASAGESRLVLQPERPSVQQLRAARTQRVVTQIEGLEEVVPGGNGELNARSKPPTGTLGTLGAPSRAAASTSGPRVKAIAVVNNPNLNVLGEPRFLQVTEALPATLVANAIAVQEANREYQERALARGGLRRMYIGTLTLSLFLAVFGAVLLAVLLGNQLAKPLLLLAEGVKQVAQGDLTPKAALLGKDELGGLTRSFADMTQQLSDARSAVQVSMSQVDAARDNLQTILDNLTAGVIVLDVRGRIQSSNPGATRILRTPLAAWHRKVLSEVPGLEAFGKDVQAQFANFQEPFSELPIEAAPHAQEQWQQSFELNAAMPGSPDNAITLIARGAKMSGTEEFLLVFDDVSEMVSAQRAQAWGEVARRLAHEIKNPLTPIQLSAERLEMKLSGKVGESEQLLLTKSVKTIVDQVDALKRLVNEFRDYARLPAAELKPTDLNALVGDILQLYASENAVVPISAELDLRAPLILGDAEQLRQVIHNLLQNAQDAQEGKSDGAVTVKTDYSESSRRVRLSVRDNGAGFPEHILKRAFEPYVTTKIKGTGLGLAVVKKIADEHGARIDISNRIADGVVQGAQVSLSFGVAA